MDTTNYQRIADKSANRNASADINTVIDVIDGLIRTLQAERDDLAHCDADVCGICQHHDVETELANIVDRLGCAELARDFIVQAWRIPHAA